MKKFKHIHNHEDIQPILLERKKKNKNKNVPLLIEFETIADAKYPMHLKILKA